MNASELVQDQIFRICGADVYRLIRGASSLWSVDKPRTRGTTFKVVRVTPGQYPIIRAVAVEWSDAAFPRGWKQLKGERPFNLPSRFQVELVSPPG